jgi:hypothetical protein
MEKNIQQVLEAPLPQDKGELIFVSDLMEINTK